MPTTSTLFVVITTATIILIIPGPNMLYVLTRGIGEGRRTAMASSLGIDSGTFIHVIAATIGLSAVLASSAVAFTAVKYFGATYMVYLGIRTLLSRDAGSISTLSLSDGQLKRVYLQGMFVCVLNPKVALFFLAFLPQFVDTSRGNVSMQCLIFGMIFFLLGVIVDGLCALSSGAIGGWLLRNPAMGRWQRIFSGIVYLVLGVATVFSSQISGGNK